MISKFLKSVVVGSCLFVSGAYADLTNIDELYTEVFQYSLPKSILESYFDGKAFDHQKSYTQEEKEALKEDIAAIYAHFAQEVNVEKIAVMTAGAPGAGKTVLMEKHLKQSLEANNHFAYVDPDAVCLKFMDNTWGQEMQQPCDCSVEGMKRFRKHLYDKWRPGSNAACHTILGHLIKEGKGFYFGTTSSSPMTKHFLQFLKDQEYQIHMLCVFAPDEVRWDSIVERDKIFVQTTQEDVISKSPLVIERVKDTFLDYADQIDFYYRQEVDQDAVLVAKWFKESEKEFLEVVNLQMYEELKTLYNQIGSQLNNPISFEEAVEKRAIMMKPFKCNES